MENRGVKDDFNIFDVSTWTNGLPLCVGGYFVGGIWEGSKGSVLNMLSWLYYHYNYYYFLSCTSEALESMSQ